MRVKKSCHLASEKAYKLKHKDFDVVDAQCAGERVNIYCIFYFIYRTDFGEDRLILDQA